MEEMLRGDRRDRDDSCDRHDAIDAMPHHEATRQMRRDATMRCDNAMQRHDGIRRDGAMKICIDGISAIGTMRDATQAIHSMDAMAMRCDRCLLTLINSLASPVALGVGPDAVRWQLLQASR